MDQMMNDPAVMEYLLAQGGMNNEASDLERQQMLANAMRDRTALTGGRQAGRQFVADSPLQALAAGIGAYRGGQQDAATAAGMQGIGQRRQSAVGTLADSLKRKQGMPADPSFGGVGAAPY